MTTTQDRFQAMVGERVKLARRDIRLTQEQVSEALGFKDRQILANIEAGKRKLAAEELLKLMNILKKPMEFFTDSSLLIGEGQFCWRATVASAPVLDEFEAKAGRWIASFRSLGEEKGEPFRPLISQLALTERSSYEEAHAAGEALAREWELGEIPAVKLVATAEKQLKILMLWVDAPPAISGAACHLRDLNTILINRRDPDGRRHYDFAHELFHLLTWNRMPPQHLDVDPKSGKIHRIEQLANNFASALLMPESGLKKRWEEREGRDIHDWINETASAYHVTSIALYWRLRALGWLSEGDALDVHADRLTWNGQTPSEQTLPKSYSSRFVERLHWGIETGHASVRWTAKLLDCSIEEMKDLFHAYGLEAPFDL